MDAPDLKPDDGKPPEPPEEGGGHKPDPDWKIVGMFAFMVGFTSTTAVRYAIELIKVLAR